MSMPIDPQALYKQTLEAAGAGRYAEALEGYIWFHDHALTYEPALAGVRLSYALEHWKELGNLYPPALVALTEIRDLKTTNLLKGARSRKNFHDVVSINEELNQLGLSYKLFCQLNEQDHEFAKTCISLAMPSIVDAEDYELALSFIPSPEGAVKRLVAELNSEIDDLAELDTKSAEMRMDAYVHIYGNELARLFKILAGTNNQDESTRLKDLFIRLIANTQAREAIREII